MRDFSSTIVLFIGFLACDSSLDGDFEGKACDTQGRCASGFICNPALNACFRPAPDSGSDTPSTGGTAGADAAVESGLSASGNAGVAGTDAPINGTAGGGGLSGAGGDSRRTD
jgi:hypothetical protein